MEITTVVTGAWNAFATKITAFLPELIGAIIIFVVGLIVAKLLKVGTVKLRAATRDEAKAACAAIKTAGFESREAPRPETATS